MEVRGVLSSLENTPISARRPPQTKYVSPSTSRQPGLNSIGTPASSLLKDAVDEEKERRNRRRSRIVELQRNFGTSPGESPAARRATPLSGLTSAQLAEHYTNCIQLSAENKINSKNAFGLHLIDYMAELLKKRELENFQVASSTLDASAKIYAGRVDNIHSETYKVLSGLGSSKPQASNEEQDAEDALDADAEGGTMAKEEQKKKRKTKSKIIKTNLKSINASKFDLEFEVDPMFQVMSATFDEGGASGLLMNHLRCYDDEQLLILDSNAIVPVVEAKPVAESTPTASAVDIDEVRELLSKVLVEDRKICPALSQFRLTGWDGSEMSSAIAKGMSEFAFDPNGDVEPVSAVEDDLASLPGDLDPADLRNISDDEDGGDGAEGDRGDNFTEYLSSVKGDGQTAEFIHSAFNELTEGSAGKLMQILASQPSDYSYFNKVLMRAWAGPAHWKTVPMSRDSSLRPLSKTQKSKVKKAPFGLTYDKAGDFEKKFKVSKATALTKATLQKYTKKRTTLPEDLHMEADRHFQLFLRPSIMIKRQETATGTIGVDEGVAAYDYNNIHDKENFCPAVGSNSDDDDTPDLGFNFSEDSRGFNEEPHSHLSQPSLPCNDTVFNATSLTGDKLLSQPYKVAKIDIDYAKTAKRVDVRKLKAAMWSLLTSQHDDNQVVPQEGDTGHMSTNWEFQTLLQRLPDRVSQTTARNLSIPIAFVCLLHLANEKSLKIMEKEMADLIITQD